MAVELGVFVINSAPANSATHVQPYDKNALEIL